MEVQHFFDPVTFTLTYLVSDPETRDAVVIDPVLNFDQPSGKISTTSADAVIAEIVRLKLKPHFILETHAHADHLSGSQIFKLRFPDVRVAISERILGIQKVFRDKLLVKSVLDEGKDFDYLFKDGETLRAGSLTFRIIPTPGHTPACSSFLFGVSLFTGDALFMPDYGTGRCDFPGGSAEELFHSVNRLYELPDETIVYVGHDYQPGNRELRFRTTIGESKSENIQLKAGTKKAEFVTLREARDRSLKAPLLLYPSLQVNIVAGKLPEEESNGISYLRIPLSHSR